MQSEGIADIVEAEVEDIVELFDVSFLRINFGFNFYLESWLPYTRWRGGGFVCIDIFNVDPLIPV